MAVKRELNTAIKVILEDRTSEIASKGHRAEEEEEEKEGEEEEINEGQIIAVEKPRHDDFATFDRAVLSPAGRTLSFPSSCLLHLSVTVAKTDGTDYRTLRYFRPVSSNGWQRPEFAISTGAFAAFVGGAFALLYKNFKNNFDRFPLPLLFCFLRNINQNKKIR